MNDKFSVRSLIKIILISLFLIITTVLIFYTTKQSKEIITLMNHLTDINLKYSNLNNEYSSLIEKNNQLEKANEELTKTNSIYLDYKDTFEDNNLEQEILQAEQSYKNSYLEYHIKDLYTCINSERVLIDKGARIYNYFDPFYIQPGDTIGNFLVTESYVEGDYSDAKFSVNLMGKETLEGYFTHQIIDAPSELLFHITLKGNNQIPNTEFKDTILLSILNYDEFFDESTLKRIIEDEVDLQGTIILSEIIITGYRRNETIYEVMLSSVDIPNINQ